METLAMPVQHLSGARKGRVMSHKFLTYHPHLSYLNNPNTCFIRPNGKPCEELNPDTEALFNLGENAFRLLGEPTGTVEDFDLGMGGYLQFVEELRKNVSEAYITKRLTVKNLNGEIYQPDFQVADNGWILDFAWHGLTKPHSGNDLSELSEIYKEAYLFHVFYEIDNALIGIFLDGREAISASIGAANALANAMAIESGNAVLQNARQEMSLRGAMAKLANDPKQKAKTFVFNCWQVWQEEHERYEGKADFARNMLKQEQCKSLKSQKKIEDWCRNWEKVHPAG